MKSPEFSFEFEISTDLIRENSDSQSFLTEFVNKYDTTNYKEIESLAVPLAVFSQNISPLKALVKYFHENKNLKFSEIAKILSRDPRTIWTEYNLVKNHTPFSSRILASEAVYVDSRILSIRDFSILESLCFELVQRGYSQKKIARMLGKSPKTIWTVLDRINKKKMLRGGKIK